MKIVGLKPEPNFLLAVSGGVDSVVLLDLLATEGKYNLTVAHFDHGIREDSAADARFVEAQAARYGLPFIGRRENLGREASEELARERRYEFLRSEARERNAIIVTAHHSGDVAETMAINLIRGTGWRGIAVMDNPEIMRPLLPFSKMQILQHAVEKRLEWVEDSTNSSGDYMRNRIRRALALSLSTGSLQTVLDLWRKQVKLKREIDGEIDTLLLSRDGEYSRYFFTAITSLAAAELLRGIVVKETGHSLTRPLAEQALIAIKTGRPGTRFDIGDAWIKFTQESFSISVKTP